MVPNIAGLTVGGDATLQETMQVIDRTNLGIAFVVDERDRLIGVTTDGDIRSGILSGFGLEEPVETVMNDAPVVIRERWDKTTRRVKLRAQGVDDLIGDHATMVVPVVDEDKRLVDFEFVTNEGTVLKPDRPESRQVSSVLVIGGAGYIGSVLCRLLLERGYQVRVLDSGVYGTHGIDNLRERDDFTLFQGDMRSIETVTEAITGVDAVVHLGALVGDPASGINPQKTLEINYHSTHMIASICRYHQINRFVFASTCSVYGKPETPETLLSEDDDLNPVSLYAKTKIESERAILDLADGNFSPTIFRMATIYGLSPRMRFDLVVNIMSAKAHSDGEVSVFGGEQYRPLVHVADAARTYVQCLEAPIKDVGNEIFNVGSEAQNYRIEEVAEIVTDQFPDADITHHPEDEDERSYQVDFSKIRNTLDFEPEESIASGAREIKQALEAGRFPDYTDEKYSNYRTLEDASILTA